MTLGRLQKGEVILLKPECFVEVCVIHVWSRVTASCSMPAPIAQCDSASAGLKNMQQLQKQLRVTFHKVKICTVCMLGYFRNVVKMMQLCGQVSSTTNDQ